LKTTGNGHFSFINKPWTFGLFRVAAPSTGQQTGARTFAAGIHPLGNSASILVIRLFFVSFLSIPGSDIKEQPLIMAWQATASTRGSFGDNRS